MQRRHDVVWQVQDPASLEPTTHFEAQAGQLLDSRAAISSSTLPVAAGFVRPPHPLPLLQFSGTTTPGPAMASCPSVSMCPAMSSTHHVFPPLPTSLSANAISHPPSTATSMGVLFRSP